MIKSKLIDVLEALSGDEIKELEKYVNSPYFNSNKKLISAFSFFKKNYGNFSGNNCTKELLYSHVFPNQPYRDTEVRKLLSGLTALTEGYLTQKVYDNDVFEKNINLVGSLVSKKLIKPAEKILKELEENSAAEKMNGQHYFFELMKIQIKKKSIELKNETFKTNDFAEDKINSYLLNYFVSFSTKIVQNIKAKQYYNLLAKEQELTEFFSLVDINKFIKWLESTGNEYSETLIMNLCIIKCVNNGYDRDSYFRFKELLLKNHSLYSSFELNNLFTCIQGIQIERIRGNAPDALAEIFDINNLILKYETYAFFPGGNMPYSTFVTMITIGITYKKFEWVKEFIDKYSQLLQDKHRESLYNYAMAELSYAESKTGEALKYTSKIGYEGFLLKHEVNILKLKIFYDENDYIAIQYQLDTYKKLVEGNKFIGQQQYDNYSGFLKNYSELVRIKENNDKLAAGVLLNKIKSNIHLQSKDWLIEKVTELS